MIDLANFTDEELKQLADIHTRVQEEKHFSRIRQIEEENKIMRRMLLEAITCILHGRRPNDEFVRRVDSMLRLDRLPVP